MKIAFYDTKPYDKQFFNLVNEEENFNFKIKYFPSRLNPDTAILSKGYDVVCVFVNDNVDKEVVEILVDNGVKMIALRCAGYNNVDLKATHGKIRVVRVPEYSPCAVAEHTVALILALNRKIHRAFYRTLDHNFSINGLLGFDMNGKTAGCIGTGKIGRCLIKILKGFSMNVIAYDPYPNEKFAEELGYKYVDLDTLYETSDIISLNCPLTKDTYHLINKHSIAKMKDTVMLVNTGRGPLIDSVALIDALKQGKVGSAGLDVYEEESEYFFEDFSLEVITDDVLARLLTFPNVLITSHQGFFTKEALCNIATTTLNNIKAYLSGEELVNEVCHKCQ